MQKMILTVVAVLIGASLSFAVDVPKQDVKPKVEVQKQMSSPKVKKKVKKQKKEAVKPVQKEGSTQKEGIKG